MSFLGRRTRESLDHGRQRMLKNPALETCFKLDKIADHGNQLYRKAAKVF